MHNQYFKPGTVCAWFFVWKYFKVNNLSVKYW